LTGFFIFAVPLKIKKEEEEIIQIENYDFQVIRLTIFTSN